MSWPAWIMLCGGCSFPCRALCPDSPQTVMKKKRFGWCLVIYGKAWESYLRPFRISRPSHCPSSKNEQRRKPTPMYIVESQPIRLTHRQRSVENGYTPHEDVSWLPIFLEDQKLRSFEIRKTDACKRLPYINMPHFPTPLQRGAFCGKTRGQR